MWCLNWGLPEQKNNKNERQLFLSLGRKWVAALCHFHSSAATLALLPQKRSSTGCESVRWSWPTPEAGIRWHVRVGTPEARRSEAPAAWNDAGGGMEIPAAFSANLIFSWAKRQKTHSSSSSFSSSSSSECLKSFKRCLTLKGGDVLGIFIPTVVWQFLKLHSRSTSSRQCSCSLCSSYENKPFVMSQIGPLLKNEWLNFHKKLKPIFSLLAISSIFWRSTDSGRG